MDLVTWSSKRIPLIPHPLSSSMDVVVPLCKRVRVCAFSSSAPGVEDSHFQNFNSLPRQTLCLTVPHQVPTFDTMSPNKPRDRADKALEVFEDKTSIFVAIGSLPSPFIPARQEPRVRPLETVFLPNGRNMFG